MGYFVHVIARTSGFYDDVVVKLPIVIQPRDENEAVNAAMEELEQLQEEEEEEENAEEENNEEDDDEEDKKEDDEEDVVDEILSGDYEDI